MGSAGSAFVSGAGRFAGRLAGALPASVRGRASAGFALVAEVLRGAGFPGAESDSVPVAGCRDGGPGSGGPEGSGFGSGGRSAIAGDPAGERGVSIAARFEAGRGQTGAADARGGGVLRSGD